MKKLIPLIALLTSLSGLSQDPLLTENDWYFQYGTLDGIDFTLPYPSFEAKLEFYADTFVMNYPECEETLSDDITYNGTESFNLYGFTLILPGICDPENFIYGKHYPFYYDSEGMPKTPFSYLIEGNSGDYQLTITNSNGDTAVYGNMFLSQGDFNEHLVTLYPNPFKDRLTIGIEELPYDLKIYDISGKPIVQKQIVERKDSDFDFSFLESGLYFVELNFNGTQYITRIIKL